MSTNFQHHWDAAQEPLLCQKESTVVFQLDGANTLNSEESAATSYTSLTSPRTLCTPLCQHRLLSMHPAPLLSTSPSLQLPALDIGCSPPPIQSPSSTTSAWPHFLDRHQWLQQQHQLLVIFAVNNTNTTHNIVDLIHRPCQSIFRRPISKLSATSVSKKVVTCAICTVYTMLRFLRWDHLPSLVKPSCMYVSLNGSERCMKLGCLSL